MVYKTKQLSGGIEMGVVHNEDQHSAESDSDLDATETQPLTSNQA